MSEIPPTADPIPPPLAPTPPPKFVAYPRGNEAWYGSADRLQALSDGYFGLNWAFAATILIYVAYFVVAPLVAQAYPVETFLLFPLVVVGAMCLPFASCKKLASGMGWQPSSAWLSAIVVGIVGLLGYVVLQIVASSEIRRYGVKTGILGVRKREIRAAIAHLRAVEEASPAPGIPFQK